MDIHLRVRAAFGDYARGHTISDPAEIETVKAAGQMDHCVPFDASAAHLQDEPAKAEAHDADDDHAQAQG